MAATEIIGIRLPYPPSLNHYWRHCRGLTFISKEGQAFRQTASAAFRQKQAEKLTGRLAVEIELCAPNLRWMDLDNALKAMLDALQHAGAYDNDGQIDRLSIWRGPIAASGLALVTIREITADAPAWTPAMLFDA